MTTFKTNNVTVNFNDDDTDILMEMGVILLKGTRISYTIAKQNDCWLCANLTHKGYAGLMDLIDDVMQEHQAIKRC